MRRSEATALTWADVELRDNGSDLLQVHRPKTDPEGEGVVIYIGRAAAEALQSIVPEEAVLDPRTPVFGLSPRQSAGESTPRPRQRASATGTPDTAAASGWTRTWSRMGLSCRR